MIAKILEESMEDNKIGVVELKDWVKKVHIPIHPVSKKPYYKNYIFIEINDELEDLPEGGLRELYDMKIFPVKNNKKIYFMSDDEFSNLSDIENRGGSEYEFKIGQKVHVEVGMFSGYPAIIEEINNLQLKLKIFLKNGSVYAWENIKNVREVN